MPPTTSCHVHGPLKWMKVKKQTNNHGRRYVACSYAFSFADEFQLSSAMCLTKRASGANFSGGIILRVLARHLQTLATAKHIWCTQTFGNSNWLWVERRFCPDAESGWWVDFWARRISFRYWEAVVMKILAFESSAGGIFSNGFIERSKKKVLYIRNEPHSTSWRDVQWSRCESSVGSLVRFGVVRLGMEVQVSGTSSKKIQVVYMLQILPQSGFDLPKENIRNFIGNEMQSGKKKKKLTQRNPIPRCVVKGLFIVG